MEKAPSLPPPYDEAPAYPRSSPSRRRSRRWSRPLLTSGALSVRTALSLVITIGLFYMCYHVSQGLYAASQHDGAGHVGGFPLSRHHIHFNEAAEHCRAHSVFPDRPDPSSRKSNPRWTTANGQQGTVVLRNARLFDGEDWVREGNVDIVMAKGLIQHVVAAGSESAQALLDDEQQTVVEEYDVQGRYVTPGLVDMHSHHLVSLWPSTPANADDNEMNPDTKAITSFLRVQDGLKAYDQAATLIASGGVTSSLIIPGSANIVGGEGVTVKNSLYSGEHGEPVVEDLLLERGIPAAERHRYMKMAFGENPKGLWDHTRMGVAWNLRKHLQQGKEMMERQDDYCEALNSVGATAGESVKSAFVAENGRYPLDLQLENIIGVLRGRVIVQNHNYEPQDMETMLRISEEFGYRVWGFHHATEAWQIPEMLRERAHNVTIATFAEFSGYKWESYSPSLYGASVLDAHGIAVAYKSDHTGSFTNAKYLMSQAAVGHAFKHPEKKALQAVTSIPARAIDLDFRVGYTRAGYDADVVIWNQHPLKYGATPLQVFIDGLPQLDQENVQRSMGENFTSMPKDKETSRDVQSTGTQLQVRQEPDDGAKEELCAKANTMTPQGSSFVFRGINKAIMDHYPEFTASVDAASVAGESMDLVIEDGRVSCVGTVISCQQSAAAVMSKKDAVEIQLQNGHVMPGLTAVTAALGMREIAAEESTGDGDADKQKIGDVDSVDFAKDGVWLDGKQFARARLGGVTRVVTPPYTESAGLVSGVSVEILTSGKKSLSQGGIVKGQVALHLEMGDSTKMSEGTISNGIKNVRKMLKDGQDGKLNETVYGQASRGDLPVVVFASNKYDMEQLVMLKREYPAVKLVIQGGAEAPYVAKELAEANIPVILTEGRPAPASFRSKDAVPGPPLTRSVASHLHEAGVVFAVAVAEHDMKSDFRIHDTLPEAAWIGQYAGLSEKEIVASVTTNMEAILNLEPSRDLVVYEGNPLELGALVVLSFHAEVDSGVLEVATCFPAEDELVVSPVL